MSWRIVYIEDSELLTLHLDNILIKYKDEDVTIPISDIHTMIIDNYKTTLSVHLVNSLTKSNINLVLCNLSHMPQSLLLPLHGNHQSSYMLRKQLGWDSHTKSILHQIIIQQKITQQKSLLCYIHADSTSQSILEKYVGEIEPGDVTNREGLSSKVYFRALFGNEFKRFEDDVINAGLNYGYAILRSQISKVIVGKGLNPSLGIFHRGPSNDFNLSDDVIEPFRPLIDFWVYKNLRMEKIFTKEHRLSLIKITLSSVRINHQSQSLFNTITLYVEWILQMIETNCTSPIIFPEILFHEL